MNATKEAPEQAPPADAAAVDALAAIGTALLAALAVTCIALVEIVPRISDAIAKEGASDNIGPAPMTQITFGQTFNNQICNGTGETDLKRAIEKRIYRSIIPQCTAVHVPTWRVTKKMVEEVQEARRARTRQPAPSNN